MKIGEPGPKDVSSYNNRGKNKGLPPAGSGGANLYRKVNSSTQNLPLVEKTNPLAVSKVLEGKYISVNDLNRKLYQTPNPEKLKLRLSTE